MATLGNTHTPSYGWFLQGINVNNACYSAYTVPSPGILVSDIAAYFDLDTAGPATAYVAVWNQTTGALIASAAISSVPNGAHSASGQAWHSGSVGSIYIPSGTGIVIGFWVAQSNGFVTSAESSGSSYYQVNSGSSPSGLGAGTATGFGEIGSYITYTSLPAPTLTSASPSAAPAGQSVTLTGTSLLHTTGITCCGVTVTSYTITDDSHITMTVPAGAAGAGTIVVTTPAGTASLAFVAGQLYGDSGTAFASGVLVYADTGSAWVSSGVQVWADDGTSWHQIG